MEYSIFNDQARKFENKNRKLTIEYFNVFRILGKGELSEVYLVQSKKKKKLYALKKIDKQLARQLQLVDQIKKELEFQIRYTHENILKIYTHFEDKNYLYIVKEYAENGTLDQLMKKSKLSTKQKAKIIQDISKALIFIHGQDLQVKHINLSMEKVFINLEFSAKLQDLGHFEAINASPRSKLEKPYYISPDILKGESMTPKTSVWSLGVILYKIFSGKFPFQPLHFDSMSDQESFLVMKNNILNNKPENLHKFSPMLRKLLKQMLQKNAHERISLQEVINSGWVKGHTPSQNIFQRMVTSIKSKSMKKQILRNERDSYQQKFSLSPKENIWASDMSSHNFGFLNKSYRNTKSNENINTIKESTQEYGIFDSQIDEDRVLGQIMNIKAKQVKRKDFYLQLITFKTYLKVYIFSFFNQFYFLLFSKIIMEQQFTQQQQQLNQDTLRNQLLKVEKQLIQKTVKNIQHIQVQDVFIDECEYIHCVEINKVQKNDSNHIIMLHGFGANASSFYKLINYLQDKYFITLVDLPGQGFSYPNPNLQKLNSVEKWIEYFCGTLNKFMTKMNYNKFFLAGHSFGGFISAHYYSRYYNQVKGLFLISPAGFNKFKDEFHEEHRQRMEKMPRIKRWIYKFLKERIYTQKYSPFDYAYQPFRSLLIHFYISNQRFNFSSQDKILIKQLMNYFVTKPQYSERSIGYCLSYSVQSTCPIIEVLQPLKQNHNKVYVFYGEKDWMDTNRTIQQLKIQKSKIKVDIIQKCDHQIILQNPEQLSKLIKKYIRNLNKNSKNQLSNNVSNTLGIDFGSEFIKAAFITPGRQLTSVEDQMSSKLIDAVIVFCDFNIFFEYKARQKQQQEKCDSFQDLHLLMQNLSIQQFEQLGYKNLKQDEIGILFPIRKHNIRLKENERYIDDEFYYLRQEEILAIMFQRIYKYTENMSGEKIQNMSLTIPSNSISMQSRYKILSALKLADLKPQIFLTQNSAAVYYHVFQNYKTKKSQDRYIVVLNIGYSGTMISLIKIFSLERQLRNKKLEYIPTIQIEQETFSQEFNGRLLDQCILDYILLTKDKQGISTQQKLKLLQKIKKAKKVLSVNKEVKIELNDIEKGAKPLILYKKDFYDNCAEHFNKFEYMLQNFQQNIQNDILNKIKDIEIIGGITIVPKVKEIINKIFQMKPSNHIDGNFSPSFGAALSSVKYTDGIKTKEIILQENPQYNIEFEIEKDNETKKIILFDFKSIKKKRVITLNSIKRNFNFKILVENQNYEIEYRIKGISQFLEKYHEKDIIESKVYLVFILNEFGLVEFESVKAQLVEQYIQKIQKKEIKKTKKHEKKLNYTIKSQTYQALFDNIDEKKISLRRLFSIKQIEIHNIQFSQQKSALGNACSQIKSIEEEKSQYLTEDEIQDLQQKWKNCEFLTEFQVTQIQNIQKSDFNYVKLQEDLQDKDFNEKQKLLTTEMKKFIKVLQSQLETLNRRITLEKREQGAKDYALRIVQEFQDYIISIKENTKLSDYYNENFQNKAEQQINLLQKLIQQNETRKMNEPQILTYDSLSKNHDILDEIIESIKKYNISINQKNEEL